jgi:O-methyltransferase involved in polyketide biosynthesis
MTADATKRKVDFASAREALRGPHPILQVVLDQWVRGFLAAYPHGTVVELGAGLSTRFERIDNGTVTWIDLDLPDVVDLRRRYVSESARRTFLGASLLDPSWPSQVKARASGPYFFVTEGVVMHLAEQQVRGLLALIADAFPGGGLAMDALTPSRVDHQRDDGAPASGRFRWGVADLVEVTGWDSRMEVADSVRFPEAARRFPHQVPTLHRLVAAVGRRVAPHKTACYQAGRIEFASI